MFFDVPKTKALPMNFASSTPVGLTSRGVVLPVVDEAHYLGLHIPSATGFQDSIGQLEERLWAAWAGVQRRYSKICCAKRIAFMVDLYLTCLPPIISYIWMKERWSNHIRQAQRWYTGQLQLLSRFPTTYAELGAKPGPARLGDTEWG